MANLIQHENNLTEMEIMKETKKSIAIQKIVKPDESEQYTKKQIKVEFQNDLQTKNDKKRKTNTSKKISKNVKKNETFSAENAHKSKIDMKLKKMEKVKIISNETGCFTQNVDFKGCKEIKIQDVIKVPSKSTKKTETNNVNYYNNRKEIFKILTDFD